MVNTELFKKIRDQIKREPTRFAMEDWEQNYEESEIWYRDYFDPATGWETASPSECSTARCVAGWAIHFEAERLGLDVNQPLYLVRNSLGLELGLDSYSSSSFTAVGTKVLGLNENQSLLFYLDEEEAYKLVNEYAEGRRG
jgi:hypothetical protein